MAASATPSALWAFIARRAVLAVLVGAAVVTLPSCLTRCLGGAFSHRPEELKTGLSPRAAALVEAAYRDVDPARLADYHTHVAGLGAGGTGAYVNPQMLTWWHPIHRLKFLVYLSGAAVDDVERADQQYVERLVALVRGIERHGKHHLLAFDEHVGEDGKVDPEHTEFYMPDARILELAKAYPDLFRPVISVHPYRADALARLEDGARKGARFVKWLPNAMGIDPASPRCTAYYEKMRELRLVLLAHSGEEKAVDAEEAQALGNPLRLRAALDRGVRVIVAHCASLGDDVDLDDPERKRVSSFRLFLRLMDEKKYEGLVFGEISAMTQFNRLSEDALGTLIREKKYHARLVNGSDYPLPAINVVIRTGKLEGLGYITADEREALNEIYDYNPLLFDFALKRTIRAPDTEMRFPPAVFMENPGLP